MAGDQFSELKFLDKARKIGIGRRPRLEAVNGTIEARAGSQVDAEETPVASHVIENAVIRHEGVYKSSELWLVSA